jgi:putative transposase
LIRPRRKAHAAPCITSRSDVREDRQFEATGPNQRWVADFTYIWTEEGWLFFAVVMDLFSRRIVGWSMSTEMTAQLVTDALVMAIWRRGRPKELLHHSDQDSTPVSSSNACLPSRASPAA